MIKYIFILLSSIILVACNYKTAYLTPDIKGKIIDEKTKEPIKDQGYIAIYLTKDNSQSVKTDGAGEFFLPATENKSFFKNKIENEYRRKEPILYIMINGYPTKSIDYSKYSSVPKTRTLYEKSAINIGTVYLSKK